MSAKISDDTHKELSP